MAKADSGNSEGIIVIYGVVGAVVVLLIVLPFTLFVFMRSKDLTIERKNLSSYTKALKTKRISVDEYIRFLQGGTHG